MSNFPPSNLPGLAVPWGRAVEEALADSNARITSLEDALRISNQTVGALTSHTTDLQNYIRKICDIAGYSYPPVAAPPPPPAPPAPTPEAPPVTVRKTHEAVAAWSATWYQSFKRTKAGGTNDDRQSLYQRGSGYTYSLWRFDVGPAAGKNIVSVQMYLSNISTYYNGAFTAFFGTHGYSGEPATRPGGRQNGFDVGWSAGEAKWIDIPTWAYGGLSNGSIQGFTMGDTNAETRNFARFNGVGRPGAPVIRITYDS